MEEDKVQLYYLQIDEVKHTFIQQLIKDAAMCGIDVESAVLSFDSLNDLIQKVEKILNQLSNTANGFEKIQSWLYRVDVSEAQIKNKLKQHPENTFNQIAAEMIIKRTLQKVVWRYLHNQGKL